MTDRYDLVVGGGEAGPAADHLARARGASVASAHRELFGGCCPFGSVRTRAGSIAYRGCCPDAPPAAVGSGFR